MLKKSQPKQGEFEPFFREIEIQRIAVSGAIFYLVKGYGFNYEAYRKDYLTPIKEKYYEIPEFLPVREARHVFGLRRGKSFGVHGHPLIEANDLRA